MATPSPIYQQTGGNQLYYNAPGSAPGAAPTAIANPQQLQQLAQQGAVQVGQPYLPYNSQSPSTPTGASTVAPGANSSPTVAPTASPDSSGVAFNTEKSPGVFNASSLVDFYNNQIQLQKDQYTTAQKAQADTAAKMAALQAPNLGQSYHDQYIQNIAPLDQNIMDLSKKLADNQSTVRGIETDIRNEMGGRASESAIQEAIAQRSKPLLLQQEAITGQLNAYQGQKQNLVGNLQTSLGYQQQDYTNQSQNLQNQNSLAKDVVSSYQGLLEKGASATNQEKTDFRQLFQTLLFQAPDVLKNLTQDETQQLQQGFIPQSVMSKIGNTINQQKVDVSQQKAATKIFGNAQTGFYHLDAQGNPEQLIPPGGNGLTQNQLVTAAQKMMAANPDQYPTLQSAISDIQSSVSGGTTKTPNTGPNGSGSSLVSNNPVSSKIINGYDFTNYATDTNWGNAVTSTLNKLPTFNSAQDITNYIKKSAPGSQITGDMVMNAAQQFNVDPSMIVAIAQHESGLGTLGVGAKTFNAGNVGNVDSGATKNMGSWQSGLNALAQNISQRALTPSQNQNQNQKQVNSQGLTFNQYLAQQESQAGMSFSPSKVQQMKDQFNASTSLDNGSPLPSKDEKLASDLAQGSMTLEQLNSLLGRSKQALSKKQNIYIRAAQINPNFSPAQFDIQNKYAGSQQTQAATVAINTVLPNIDRIIQMSDAFSRTDLPAVNKILSSLGYQTGDAKVSTIQEAQQLIGDELGTALGAGGMSDMKLQLGLHVVDPNLSPDQFMSNMQMVKEYLNNRLGAMNQQKGVYAPSGNSPALLSSETAPKQPVDLSKFDFKM